MQNPPYFPLFIRETYTSNVLFDCIYLSICSKSMGSGTHLQNSMDSAEPMEPLLTQPLLHNIDGIDAAAHVSLIVPI